MSRYGVVVGEWPVTREAPSFRKSLLFRDMMPAAVMSSRSTKDFNRAEAQGILTMKTYPEIVNKYSDTAPESSSVLLVI
ncbi:hypothetical protein HNY73_015673 [Argiope bruennichi]|uniref:Uncharacterized protein n=1 Tax=Argiope bruennichi TaxID=94029 RepID=A0A8T0EH90_ARGBR|nr:hypothetical protein HNY73_015673 [Argiope bruennichi]